MEKIYILFPDDLVTSFLVFVALLFTLLWFFRNRSTNPSPPGPFCFPFVGSISIAPQFLSNVKRHQLLIDLGRKYRRICSFKIGNSNFVLLNDLETIKEAFITKGDVISDRTSERVNSIVGIGGEFKKYTGLGIGEANFSKAFKERKRLALHSMKEFGLGGVSLEAKVVEETEFLIEALKGHATPPDGEIKRATDVHQRLIHLAVSNVISSVVFGRRFDYGDPAFVSAVEGIKFLFSKQRGENLAQLPFARYVPYVKNLIAEEIDQAKRVFSFINEQIDSHRESFDPTVDPVDFVDLWLQKAESDGDSDGPAKSVQVGSENVRKILWDLFLAGTDTTATSVIWFLLSMMRYPDIQRRCHAEIDERFEDVDGGGGLTKDTIGRIFPYTVASMLESQRINSIANASLAHIARENTTIDGYFVPKHSSVLANIRFLHFDEKYWKDPATFDPMRWLEPVPADEIHSLGYKIVQHSQFIPFSVGKRRCLGESLAKSEYLIFCLALLKNFNFRVEDELSPPSLEGSGFVLAPQDFMMVIEQRRPKCT